MFRIWMIRLGSSLLGIAVGLLLSSLLLDGFRVGVTALIEATVIFWVVHFVVQLIALRTLLRQPSIALAGLLALASTVLALVIVALIVPGLNISGVETYVLAALIVWAATAAADTAGHRAIREERRER